MRKVNINRVHKCVKHIIDCELKIKKELSIVNSFFNFKGFEECNLDVSVNLCSGYELYIVCNGYELDLISAIEIQENKGCVEPCDIPGLTNI